MKLRSAFFLLVALLVVAALIEFAVGKFHKHATNIGQGIANTDQKLPPSALIEQAIYLAKLESRTASGQMRSGLRISESDALSAMGMSGLSAEKAKGSTAMDGQRYKNGDIGLTTFGKDSDLGWVIASVSTPRQPTQDQIAEVQRVGKFAGDLFGDECRNWYFQNVQSFFDNDTEKTEVVTLFKDRRCSLTINHGPGGNKVDPRFTFIMLQVYRQLPRSDNDPLWQYDPVVHGLQIEAERLRNLEKGSTASTTLNPTTPESKQEPTPSVKPAAINIPAPFPGHSTSGLPVY